MSKQKTVFVGLSGGVDSSVAALRLKKRGYRVVGVFIKVWHPEFMVCNWEAERLDAMRVAAHLEIPFLTYDAEDAYKQDVADYFISEYLAGRTPNPDVLCNQKVKFGSFLDFAMAKGADFIATGHYVQNIDNHLYRGIDGNKDQSYFLWSLNSDQLTKSIFPVGDTKKEAIRLEAKKAGIPTAEKKDSQGVCFLGHIDIADFLSHYTKLVPGAVLNIQGEEIGTHKGALVYTLGQRHGFNILAKHTNTSQSYVISKDMFNNTITVGDQPPATSLHDQVLIHNLVLRTNLKTTDKLEAQFRYRQTPVPVEVGSLSTDSMQLTLQQSTETPASGQSCVLYQGNLCIGGGIIS